MSFDVGLVNRICSDIENTAKSLKQHVNSPNELTKEIQRIESNLESLRSMSQKIQGAGSNADAQLTPHQNQS